jgi:hypothetical protein
LTLLRSRYRPIHLRRKPMKKKRLRLPKRSPRRSQKRLLMKSPKRSQKRLLMKSLMLSRSLRRKRVKMKRSSRKSQKMK